MSTTLEKLVAEFDRQTDASQWFDYDEENHTARIDGRYDIAALAKAVEA